MRVLKYSILTLSVLIASLGCTKIEGVGGKASIIGKLTANFYSDTQLTQFVGQGPLPDENVYIVYGTADTFYDDDIKTSYDGVFMFKYLKPGTYTVFTYENCYPCASLMKEVLFEVEITSKDEVKDLGEIILKREQ